MLIFFRLEWVVFVDLSNSSIEEKPAFDNDQAGRVGLTISPGGGAERVFALRQCYMLPGPSISLVLIHEIKQS